MQKSYYNIGEFSRITGLSIKALRLYHEKELLIPCYIDEFTKYRFYNNANLERARVIVALRGMEFPLKEIKALLENVDEDSGLIPALELQKLRINEKVLNYRKVANRIDEILLFERSNHQKLKQSFEIEEKNLTSLLYAGIRFKGKYSDVEKYFVKLGKLLKSNICGPAFCLYYDDSYMEEGADIEACFPVKKQKNAVGFKYASLPAAKVFSLIHQGPYTELYRSYAQLISFIKETGNTLDVPIREHYLKGPGLILKGNPKNFITEIQIIVKKEAGHGKD